MPITLALRVWDKEDQDFMVNLCYTVNSKPVSIKKGDVSKTKTGIRMVSISLYFKEINLP